MSKKKENAQAVTEPEPKKFELVPSIAIDEKTKSLAKKFGVNLEAVEALGPRLNDWSASVEERLKLIMEAIPNIPAQTVQILRAEAQRQREQTAQTVQAPGGPPAPDYSGIVQILQEAVKGISGGPQQPSILNDLAMESLKADIELSKTMKAAVTSKIMGKAVVEVAGAVTG